MLVILTPQVLQADGGNYCTCVNAATLALVDAGIPLREYVIGCTASLGNGDVPLIDVSHLEETMGGSNLTVAVLPLSGQVNIDQVHMEDIWSYDLPFSFKE